MSPYKDRCDHMRTGMTKFISFYFIKIYSFCFLFKAVDWLKSPEEAEPPAELPSNLQSHSKLSQESVPLPTVRTFRIKAFPSSYYFVCLQICLSNLSRWPVCLSVCLSLTCFSLQSSPVEEKSFRSVLSFVGSESKLLIVWVERFEDIGN